MCKGVSQQSTEPKGIGTGDPGTPGVCQPEQRQTVSAGSAAKDFKLPNTWSEIFENPKLWAELRDLVLGFESEDP
jgi:hypothetical protein